MNKIRRGDQVVVLSGRNKGRRGSVRRVIIDAHGRPHQVVVDGVNLLTSFVRPNPQKNEPGGVIRREAPMSISKVAAIDPGSSLPARVKISIDGEGKKSRIYYVSDKRRSAEAATNSDMHDSTEAQ